MTGPVGSPRQLIAWAIVALALAGLGVWVLFQVREVLLLVSREEPDERVDDRLGLDEEVECPVPWRS